MDISYAGLFNVPLTIYMGNNEKTNSQISIHSIREISALKQFHITL